VPGYIDNYASPGNPVIDITGTPLGILLNFVPKGSASPQTVSALPFVSTLDLPPALLAQLQTPLSQIGDQVWSQDTDANGKTMRDRTTATIISDVSAAVSMRGAGYSAYNISANLPTTGILRSLIIGGDPPSPIQTIFLSYELLGISVSFTSTTPYTGGLIPDPTYNVTFDVELLMIIITPAEPGPFSLSSSVNVENANISASNVIAAVGDAVATFVNFITEQPTNLFQAGEGQIDSSGGQVAVDPGPFSALLAQLSAGWLAAVPFGFVQFHAFINPNSRTLNFQLTHPVDPAPVPVNAAVPAYPTLAQPILGTSTSCVEPGGSLTVTGTNFPIGQANALYVGWTDTTSGNVTESDINWGRAGGPLTAVIIPRNGSDGRNSLALTNLVANSPYVFAVRDQDLLTETPFTEPPVTITTQATDIANILLQYGATQWAVGNGQLTSTGVFSASVNIPTGLTPGTYQLAAFLNGTEIAKTSISVSAACQTRIELINPETETLSSGAIVTYPVTVRGDGFEAGTVDLYIDGPSGTQLGSVVISSGTSFQATFIWPLTAAGTHELVAQETVGGQTLTAPPITVTAENLPS
jgi:hypothetical protein